jgi:hypothetical protein
MVAPLFLVNALTREAGLTLLTTNGLTLFQIPENFYSATYQYNNS